MAYSVKEIFYTLQGEGMNAGRPAVFCRFAGCNLWSGREEDRSTAVCSFCDTDFVGTDGELGGRFDSAEALASRIESLWPHSDQSSDQDCSQNNRFVVLTGGEPLLQLDPPLISSLHQRGFEIAVETNGSIKAPPGIDWLCVSPKPSGQLQQVSGQELKFVFPQAGLAPESFESMDFQHFLIQPMDGPNIDENTRAAIAYCKAHPKWRLSLQTHKITGIK